MAGERDILTWSSVLWEAGDGEEAVTFGYGEFLRALSHRKESQDWRGIVERCVLEPNASVPSRITVRPAAAGRSGGVEALAAHLQRSLSGATGEDSDYDDGEAAEWLAVGHGALTALQT